MAYDYLDSVPKTTSQMKDAQSQRKVYEAW